MQILIFFCSKQHYAIYQGPNLDFLTFNISAKILNLIILHLHLFRLANIFIRSTKQCMEPNLQKKTHFKTKLAKIQQQKNSLVF